MILSVHIYDRKDSTDDNREVNIKTYRLHIVQKSFYISDRSAAKVSKILQVGIRDSGYHEQQKVYKKKQEFSIDNKCACLSSESAARSKQNTAGWRLYSNRAMQ
jgi:hypothetical protein